MLPVLVRRAEKAGCTVLRRRHGWQILTPTGRIITVHGTESDHRAERNTLARLRREGIHV